METFSMSGAVTNPLYRVRATDRVSNTLFAKAVGQPEAEGGSHA